ncbi:hypothetical protein PSAB6_70183 [Paraburkholderia sabiae]|nr:hypothetical protein PSAB6_70183 [Paraburkholderia sabiae]
MPAERSAGGASGHPAGAVDRYLATERCNICRTHTGTTIYICAIQYKPLAALFAGWQGRSQRRGAARRAKAERIGYEGRGVDPTH